MSTTAWHRFRKARSTAFVAAMMLASGRPAASLERFGIQVRCSIESGQLTNLYGPRRVAEITPRLCEALLATLVNDREFSLWSFSTAVGGATASLTLRVADRGSDVTMILLDFVPKEGLPVNVRDTWIHIADAHPATSDLAEAQLEREFKSHLEGPWKNQLEEALKQIPVAEARSLEVPGAAPVRIVSSLPWERYQHLRSSHFKVICPRPGYQSVTLTSTGRPLPAPFKFSGTSHPFAALVVVVVGRVEDDSAHSVTPISKILDEVKSLTPRMLFFDRFDPPGFESFLP